MKDKFVKYTKAQNASLKFDPCAICTRRHHEEVTCAIANECDGGYYIRDRKKVTVKPSPAPKKTLTLSKSRYGRTSDTLKVTRGVLSSYTKIEIRMPAKNTEAAAKALEAAILAGCVATINLGNDQVDIIKKA